MKINLNKIIKYEKSYRLRIDENWINKKKIYWKSKENLEIINNYLRMKFLNKKLMIKYYQKLMIKILIQNN